MAQVIETLSILLPKKAAVSPKMSGYRDRHLQQPKVMRSTALNSLLTPIYTIWLSILLTAGQPVWASDCPVIQPLQKYSIHQIFFTHGSDFDILDGQRKVGKIVQKKCSVGGKLLSCSMNAASW